MRQAALCAVPPCGEGIPASGEQPGANVCCLFTIAAGTLVPVLDEEGAQLRATVYNVREMAIPPLEPPNERYLLVYADPSGRWVCEVPDTSSAHERVDRDDQYHNDDHARALRGNLQMGLE